MRAVRVFVGAGILLCIAGPMPAPASSCRALPEDLQAALRIEVAYAYGKSDATCDEDRRGAEQRLRQHADAVLPCLRELLAKGMAGSGLWQFAETPPTETRWAVGLIARLRPVEGLTLYREAAGAAPPGSFERLAAEIEVAALGGREVLPALARFMAEPPRVPRESEEGLDTMLGRAADALAQHHYTEGLPALKQWKARGASYPEVDVYIAQLEVDVERLQELAVSPRLHMAALRALLRVGRRDVVESLAVDPKNTFAQAARFVLGESLQKR